jgi:DNA polymerase
MDEDKKQKWMQELEVKIATCTQCRLHESRLNTVPGEGNLDSPIVFIGEGPGRKEDETARPFVGSAGKLLTKMLTAVGLTRNDVYIANIVKCRPPKNRKPRADEVKTCTPYLEWQLSIISPHVIAPMGNSSVSYILRKYNLENAPIGEIHGRPYKVKAQWGSIVVYPLFHPAAVLYNRTLEEEMLKDYRKLVKLF